MFSGYYYPYYRTIQPVVPYYPIQPYYPIAPYYAYANYGSAVNAYQSQIGNQSVVNTGVANGINQVFNPTQIF